MKNNKILIIDDSKLIIKLVKKALLANNINGYTFTEESIITVTNGFSAIDEFSKPQQIEFVITDINMPDINGDELIEVLEDTKKLKDTKVIFITTENISKQIPNQVLKYALGIIYKPFNNVTFSSQFNTLLRKNAKDEKLKYKILQKQIKQKKVILEILSMFFKKEQETMQLQNYADEVIDEFITLDEDIKDDELAFITYHIATEIINRSELDLDLKLKSFECAFYRKLNNFGDYNDEVFFNFKQKFQSGIEHIKSSKKYSEIIKVLFYDIETLLTKITKDVAKFPPKKINMFYPYFNTIVDEFSSYDCMYKDKEIIVFLKNLEELINFREYISSYKSKKTLYKDIPTATKVFMRCETSFESIIFKIERIIPHYVGWINLYIWKRFFELKIYNYYDSDLLPNLQNLLLKNKQITMSEYKKYKPQKVIIMSKNLEILSFFKKTLEKKLIDFTFHIFPTLKHLEVWIKTNKVDRIIIDFNIITSSFQNGLEAINYFKKINFCFNAFYMQRIYLIVDDEKIQNFINSGKKYTNIHLIKRSDINEVSFTKKLFTS